MKVVNNFLGKVESFLNSTNANQKSIIYFRRAVYAMLFLKILLLWPEIPTFYQHVLSRQENYTGLALINHLIFLPFFQHSIYFTLSICMLFVAAGIFLRKHILLAILIFIISINLMSLVYLATNGGDLLLNLFVFSIIFLEEKKQTSEVKLMVSNSVWWILKINLCFLYFINGYGKIFKQIWFNGEVMQTVWQLDFYIHPHLVPSWFAHPIIAIVTAWTVILFEFAFPFLIWFKAIKNYLIVIGIVFHLLIALCLSLPDFGLTMIIAYIPFIDFENRFWRNKKKQPVLQAAH